MQIVQQIGAVLLVLSLLGAMLWLLRSRGLVGVGDWGLRKSTAPRRLEVVERIALTGTHSLHVVRFDGRTLLVGVAPQSCSLLGETGVAAVEPKIGQFRA